MSPTSTPAACPAAAPTSSACSFPRPSRARNSCFTNPFYGELLSAIEYTARKNGYHLLLGGTQEDQSYVNVAQNRGVDGIIIVDAYPGRNLQELRGMNVPIVLVDSYVKDAALSQMLNENLFFSFFYASGRTLDTEELCLMTSRSPRYYVSAACWDRNSLLWSFPAIVLTDGAYAREILLHMFTRQIRNVGQHSRYIDGTLLEPGFELDELCAPVIALERYLLRTDDEALLQEPCVKSGLLRILSLLESKRHPEIERYETFLQPTDDEIVYPYLTYDNALVWRVLLLLSRWLERPELARRAQAVCRHCVRDGQFVWSTDLQGHFDIYDEPPGSLQLLPHYGFCAMDDPVWQKTVRTIRSQEYPPLLRRQAHRGDRLPPRAASVGAVHLQQPALRPCGYGACASGPHPYGQRPGLRKRQRGHRSMRNGRGLCHLRGLPGLCPVACRALTAAGKQGMIAVAEGGTKDEHRSRRHRICGACHGRAAVSAASCDRRGYRRRQGG